MSKRNRQMPPVHPGEILREDLMRPLGISVNGLRNSFVTHSSPSKQVKHTRLNASYPSSSISGVK